MNLIKKKSFSKDPDFRETYINFYGMYRCKFSGDFYDLYFTTLEDMINNKADTTNTEEVYKNLLKMFYFNKKGSKRVEASFSSKLLATVDPDKPVWDGNVFSRLGMSKPVVYKNDKKEQIRRTASRYKDLEDKLREEYLNTRKGEDCIYVFNEAFKDEHKDWLKQITPMKKIDFVLWSMGKKKKNSK